MSGLVSILQGTGRIGYFMGEVAYWMVRPPFYWRETIKQMHHIGFQTLLPVLAVVGPTGMVVTLQGLKIFQLFGAEQMISSLLAAAIFRELSPTLSSLMVSSQAGSSIAGEIGTMRVKEEIDALEIMAVNPIQFLVIPRLLALALVCPILNALASFCGILGGYTVAVILKGHNSGAFIANLMNFMSVSDIWIGMLKASVFGVAVGVVACYRGYMTTGGAAGVGQAANNTVVQAILAVVVLNYLMTAMILGISAP